MRPGRLPAVLTPRRLRLLLAVVLMPFAAASSGVLYVGVLTAIRHETDAGMLVLGLVGIWAVVVFGTLVLLPVLLLPAAVLAALLHVGLRALRWQGPLAHSLAGGITGAAAMAAWVQLGMPGTAPRDMLAALGGGLLGGGVAALAFWWLARPEAPQDAGV